MCPTENLNLQNCFLSAKENHVRCQETKAFWVATCGRLRPQVATYSHVSNLATDRPTGPTDRTDRPDRPDRSQTILTAILFFCVLFSLSSVLLRNVCASWEGTKLFLSESARPSPTAQASMGTITSGVLHLGRLLLGKLGDKVVLSIWKIPPAGLEPAIIGLEVRRLVH